MPKFLLGFLALFSFSNLVLAGAGCWCWLLVLVAGAMDGLILCVVDEGKSNVELVATGLIAVSSLLFGVYVVCVNSA